MLKWEDLSELEQLACTYSDIHKDVYGIRPRHTAGWEVHSYKEAIAELSKALEIQMEQDKIFQQEAIAAFEELAKSYGGVETAKRWQHQAYGTDGDDEYLEYRLGLPYGYFKKAA
jgi:hypothetical protein